MVIMAIQRGTFAPRRSANQQSRPPTKGMIISQGNSTAYFPFFNLISSYLACHFRHQQCSPSSRKKTLGLLHTDGFETATSITLRHSGNFSHSLLG
jgi:hypothetical protein